MTSKLDEIASYDLVKKLMTHVYQLNANSDIEKRLDPELCLYIGSASAALVRSALMNHTLIMVLDDILHNEHFGAHCPEGLQKLAAMAVADGKKLLKP